MLAKKSHLLILIVPLILVSAVFLVNPHNRDQKTKDSSTYLVDKENKIKGKILFVNGDDKSEYGYDIREESTVFQLMKNMSEEGKISFEYRESNLGAFIESINNIKNDVSNNKFWMLYVNDKLSPVGASECKLSDGDVIEWRYVDTSKYPNFM